jgi:putative flippase GtrA
MFPRPLRPVAALLRQPEGRRFFVFLLVGGLNTAVGYGLFAAFIFLGADTSLALAAATILGVLFNFKSIGRLVFESGNVRLLPRFVGIYAVQFGINLAALKALESTGASPLLAQLLILPPLAVASFIMMRHFVFRPFAQVEKPPRH